MIAGKQTTALSALLASILLMLLMGAIAVSLGGKVNPQIVILSRTVIGLVVAAIVSVAVGVSIPFQASKALWIRSLLGALGIQFTYYAFLTLPLSTSTTVFHTAPVWAALLTWFFFGKKVGISQILAMIACLGGVLLVYQPSLNVSGLSMGSAVLSSLFSAIAIITISQMKSVPTMQIVVHSSAIAAILAAGILVITGTATGSLPVQGISPSIATLLIALGLFGCGAQFLVTFACKELSPIISTTLRVIEIPLAMLITAFSRPEPFTLMELFGGCLVAIGAATLTIYSLPPIPKLAAKTRVRNRDSEEHTVFTMR